MRINWKEFESPYLNTIVEIPNQLNYVFNSDENEEELEIFLYSELAPNIKHQGKIYNVIIPVIDAINSHLNSGTDKNKIPLLFFLDHIFHEFIRDSLNFLYTPIPYSYKSEKINKLNFSETTAFLKFKQLYENHYYKSYNYKNFDHKIFYDCLFINPNSVLEQIQSSVDNNFISFDLGIALGYLAFKNNNLKDKTPLESFEGFTEHNEIVLAMNRFSLDETKLITEIIDQKEINSCWGSGYISILAGVSYVIYILDKDFKTQKKAIDNLLNTYNRLKISYENEYDLDFPLYKYLLEDISSILFYNFLGRKKEVKTNDLSPIQNYFLQQLNNEYKTHTYSLLYAGILPKNINEEDIVNIYDIHDYKFDTKSPR